jgi:hypothetical protein
MRKFNTQEIQFLEAAANMSSPAFENIGYHKALQADFDLNVAHNP